MTIGLNRLAEERKQWRKEHPFGFFAKPEKDKNGKEGTPWEGGVYKLKIIFPDEYPQSPPDCKFTPPIFHPNVYDCGDICLSILNEEEWKPSTTLKQILLGIQHLLNNPNPDSPANGDANRLFLRDKAIYEAQVRKQAAKFKP